MFSRCFSVNSAMMNNIKILKDIFESAVEAVRPAKILYNNVHHNRDKDLLKVFQKEFSLRNKNVYVVGAGKCVLEMALAIENILPDRLTTGIVSVPTGILSQYGVKSNTIQYIEGAHNNLPDEKSLMAAESIKKLVSNLDENSLLIVLLSGGGSALLPCPISPITLKEKCDVINKLSKSGADIIELNTVRKKLSALKGGKLINLAHPAEIICFLICDIVGNHYEYIASGPTYFDNDKWFEARDIISKYNLQNSIPDSVVKVLDTEEKYIPSEEAIVNNFVLCDNTKAIEGAIEKAIFFGYETITMSNVVQRDIENISSNYIEIIVGLIKFLKKSIDINEFLTLLKTNNCSNVCINKIKQRIKASNLKYPILLIAAGEPTIKVVGKGIGGRNQQLALKFAVDLHNMKQSFEELNDFTIEFLSAGTDGFDGPTDAAGAISYDYMKSDAEKNNLLPEKFLGNNDSHTFFKNFNDGKYHLKTGHTNTNVMDIHLISIQEKS